MTPILEARDVTCTFTVGSGRFKRKRALRAVNGVNLRLEKGEVVGLVGESGCGKSTLAKLLLGLIAPTGGEIFLRERPLDSLGRRDIARHVQPVFQDPYSSLNPRQTIEAIISLPLRVHGIGSSRERRREVEHIMDVVGLARRFCDSYPSQLSGGQRQRVAIARALIMKPEIVIYDEPTSALDVSVQSQILNLLEDLRREFGLTYLLISHNLAVVEHMVDRVAVMYLGRVVEEANTDSLFREPRHPYTRALLESVLTPEPGLGVPDAHLGLSFPNPVDPPSGCTFHPRCSYRMPHCERVRPQPVTLSDSTVECHLYDEDAAGELGEVAQDGPAASRPLLGPDERKRPGEPGR